MDSKQLAQYIDHTALTAEKTEQDILKLCDEAIQYGFYSVCINSGYIPLAKEKTRWLKRQNFVRLLVSLLAPTYPLSKLLKPKKRSKLGRVKSIW